MGERIKRVLRAAAFFLILAAILAVLQLVFIYKDMPENHSRTLNSRVTSYNLSNPVQGFYELPKNSLQAAYVGASTVYCGIDPNVIYGQYGVCGYDYTGSNMMVGAEYYALREVFRTQQPRLVVIDCTFIDSRRYGLTGAANFLTPFTPLSIPKIEFSRLFESSDERAAVLLPLSKYHSRWSSLTANDFTYLFSQRQDMLLGMMGLISGDEMMNEMYSGAEASYESAGEIYETDREYIDKMAAECARNGATPMFIVTPSVIARSSERTPQIAAVGEYIENQGYAFYNYSEDARFVPKNGELADDTHLSVAGARHFSLLLAQDMLELCDELAQGQRSEYYDECLERHDALIEQIFGTEEAQNAV